MEPLSRNRKLAIPRGRPATLTWPDAVDTAVLSVEMQFKGANQQVWALDVGERHGGTRRLHLAGYRSGVIPQR